MELSEEIMPVKIVHNPEEMEELCSEIASEYLIPAGRSMILLEGELGAGKTAFCRGFARVLGISGNINSPTFNLLNVYEGERGRLYHYDLYRISAPEDLHELGFIEIWSEKCPGICIHAIEWWRKAAELLPEGVLKVLVRIESSENTDDRTVSFDILREISDAKNPT